MKRRTFNKILGYSTAASLLPAMASHSITAPASNEDRPNIVFICSDNQSYLDAGYAGHSILRTPNLDLIARCGTIFSDAYCGSPVCAPARACMMTGLYPSDNDSFCNATPWAGAHPTWGERLRAIGYHTRSLGKLDLHREHDTGFEEFEVRHGHDLNPDITAFFRRPLCYRMGERLNVTGGIREQEHPDASLARMAVRFISEQAKDLQKPWALYIGFSQPHVAYFERKGFLGLKKYWDLYPLEEIDLPQVPHDHLETQHMMFQALRQFKRLSQPISEEKIRRARAGYYAMISELDEYIGWIWRALERSGELERTVFVFTSDNGILLGEHGLFYHNCLYERAVRVPLLLAGYGIPRGTVVDVPVSHVDLIATLLHSAGIEPDSLRGHSLTSLMNGNRGSAPGFVYSESHSEGNCTGSFMIRQGDWKYLHFTWYDDLLFNVREDPGELVNRLNDTSVQGLKQQLQRILRSVVDPGRVTRRAFRKQEMLLQRLVEQNSEQKLLEHFAFRLGKGQAGALAAKLKG